MNRTASIMVFGLILAFIFVRPGYAQIESVAASVKATQGIAQLTASGGEAPKSLSRGSIVSAWDTVATNEKSKLLLSWRNGLTTSMGEFSSLLLASERAQAGVMPSIQVISGVFRFSSQPSGSSSSEYLVTTPVATIYPASFDQPADFTVEVYDPKSAAITVLSGNLRVKKPNGEESTVPSCHSVSIEEGRGGLNAMTLSTADFAKLMDATTIPGTLVADLGPCAVVSEAAPPRQPAPTYVAEYPSDYYVEDWDTIETVPYFDVAVSPYEGGYAAFIPGIGRLVVEIPVYVEPAIVQIYLRTILWERCHFWYRDYLMDARHREGELRNLLYLARASGNTNLLMQTQRRLDDLAVRSDWATRRIDRLDKMGRTLEADQRKLSGKLPAGVNLKQAISDSFYSRQNQQIAQKFQNRLKTSTEVETRLASLTGQEMASLRDRIAKEPNMGKRLALAQELSQIKNDAANGKLVIPKSQKQVAGLVDQIKKNPGADRQAQLENRLLTQIKAPADSRRTADLVNQERLASLKNDLTRFPDPQGRKILENRLTALEQSVQARQQAESNAELTRKKIDEVSKQAAREESPAKRQELLGKIHELSKTMTPGVPGMPGTSQLLEKPKLGTTEALERAKKGPSLKELETRSQAEAKRQEQLKQQQAQKQELLRQQTLDKEKRNLQAREEELRRQTELKQQQQVKQQQAEQQLLRQKALEKEKQTQWARQEELRRQSALKQQEQLKQQQAQKQELLRQQTLEREKRSQQARLEELRKQSALKQQQQLKQQQAQQQQLRQQALEKEKRSQQARQEELRKQSALKQQQLQQQQAQQQQLRQQQAQQQALRQQQAQQQLQLRQQQAQQQALQQQRQLQARAQIPGKPPQPGKGLPQFGQVEH